MENVFIYFIIFLMLAPFILEQFFDFRCWIKKSKVKPLKEEDITGYSCIDFILSDTLKECDESIDVRNEIEVGQVLTCRGVTNILYKSNSKVMFLQKYT